MPERLFRIPAHMTPHSARKLYAVQSGCGDMVILEKCRRNLNHSDVALL